MWKKQELTCQQVRVELIPYFDGELSPTRRQTVRAHLATCRDCARYFREAKGLEDKLLVGAACHVRDLRLSTQAAARIQRRFYRRMRRAVIMQRVTDYTGRVVALAAILGLTVGLLALWQWGPLGSEESAGVPGSDSITSTPLEESRDAPIFQPAECEFDTPAGYEIECGYLVVPEDRSQPSPATIRLHVAIIKNTNPNPAPDPMVHLYGGPGGSLLDRVSFYLDAGGDKILETRDYILFNQRGTRYAVPSLDCPGYLAFKWELAGEGLSPEERDDREIEFLLDCQRDLLDQGVNLAAYNSAQNAADVDDLRVALGYEQVNLYGASYGTRLALTVLRDYPKGVRSVIIDSVYPPQVDLNHSMAANAARAFNTLFEGCAANPGCDQTYPDLETTFYRIVGELNANPVQVTLSGGTVAIDGDYFMDFIFGAMYRADVIPWIPGIIGSADRGELSALSSGFEELFTDHISEGMYYSLECREEVSFESYEEMRALAADLPPQIRDHYVKPFIFELCESWASGLADPVEDEAVVSDIPTLVLTGQYDPITPPAWGQLAAETLENSFYYEFPGVGHGVIRSDGCAFEIALQFLDDPTTEPDASCIDDLPDPIFE